MSPEARLEDGIPLSAGWFVLNARDAHWRRDELRTRAKFGGEGEAHFDQLGLGMYWLEPGEPMAMYHHEAGQEDFLVLQGEALLIVEGEERPLRRWDLVHCPPRVPHVIVGAGDAPCLVLAVGARVERGSARYPVEPVAANLGAGVRVAVDSAAEAYPGVGEGRRVSAPPVFGP